MTNELGEVIWCNYEYAWGGRYTHFYKEQSLNNCAILEHDLQPIRFQGQFFDSETSLHYNRFRYYDSDVGMFIQRDPIGLLGGFNVFAYAPNPIHWVDVLGLDVKIVTSDKVAYKRIAESYAKLNTTQRGREITKRLEESSTVYKIVPANKTAKYQIRKPNSPCTNCEPNTVYIDPYNSLILPTADGDEPTSLAVLIGHELGHAIGYQDDGPNRMNNVNINENPIRKELGYPERTSYSVKEVIWEKGYIR